MKEETTTNFGIPPRRLESRTKYKGKSGKAGESFV
jgi:hypothetical protein